MQVRYLLKNHDAEMRIDALSKRLTDLPEAAQREVEALIAELERRQRTSTEERCALRDEPFAGIWKGRDDLADSSAWVRHTRQTEWQRG